MFGIFASREMREKAGLQKRRTVDPDGDGLDADDTDGVGGNLTYGQTWKTAVGGIGIIGLAALLPIFMVSCDNKQSAQKPPAPITEPHQP